MKPARFILNSDYNTVRNTGETKLTVTIPNSVIVPSYMTEYKFATTAANIGNPTDTFLVYFTSSAFPYSSLGSWGSTKPNGASVSPAYVSDEMYFEVIINGTTATLNVWCWGNGENAITWNGYGQTLTAHILTFKDPFSE